MAGVSFNLRTPVGVYGLGYLIVLVGFFGKVLRDQCSDLAGAIRTHFETRVGYFQADFGSDE